MNKKSIGVKSMNKKTLSLALAGVLSVTTLLSGCGLVEVESAKDETKSQLQISVRDAGFGTNWFSALARGFEEKYANVSFEDGKMGVQVTDIPKRDNAGSSMMGTIKTASDAVLAVENLHYVDYATADLLYDLSDIVDDELDDGSGTIASKISQDNKAYLTGYDGNYYALPWFSSPLGLTYDANLFAKRNFYFADANGAKPYANSSYTGKAYTGRGFVSASNTKKSCGPDGKYDTFDDGLPSSYEEFFYMLDHMYTVGVDGFIYYGASEHYLNYLFHGLLATYSGYDEMRSQFDFDSGDGTMRIITSFDSDGNPVVENKKINKDNGYLTSQMEGKYYAVKFLEHLFKNTNKYVYSGTMSLSNVDAQRIFIESDLSPDYKPIAMIVEGDYWYNEAGAIFTETEGVYPNATNRNFRFMSLPQKELGSVSEGEGRATTVSDGLFSYLILNNNISNDPVREELAIKFIKYCYEDASLQLTTMMSGMPILADYELTSAQYASMDNYKQSLWDLSSTARKNGQYLSPVSGSKIFLNSYSKFQFSTASKYFNSMIDEVEQEYPRRVFTSNPQLTAKDYFLGMSISETTWNSTYNIFD